MSLLSSTELPDPVQTADGSEAAWPHSSVVPSSALPAEPVPAISSATPGRVQLDGDLLRELRRTRLLSQQDLADECWRRNIRVSIATIKRAESGRSVRFRIVRELARCFDLPPMRMVQS